MNEKLLNLADACCEVMKTSADQKEARKLFRLYIQQAHDIGAGKNQDPSVGRPVVQAPVPLKAAPKVEAPKVEAPKAVAPVKEPAKKPGGLTGGKDF